MNETAEELKKYELMIIFRPDMSQEETEKEIKKAKKILTDAGADIYHEDIWDVRDLAYVINKYDKGYYVILYFTIDGKELPEIEKEFILSSKILRHLVVKSPKNYEIKKLEELMAASTESKGKPKEDLSKRAPKKVAKKKEETKEKPKAEAPEKAEEKVEEKPAAEEKPKEEPDKKSEEKSSKKAMDINDLDSKLESILDDPDIDIKI
jgi:small subunit ribosomal protein S6